MGKLVYTTIDIFTNIADTRLGDVVVGIVCGSILLGVNIGVNKRYKHKLKVPIPIEFDGIQFEEGFRADLVVEGKVSVELKSVEKVHPAHKKQVLTYLKLTGLRLGYLLNFGAPMMKQGISRIINGTIE